MSSCRRLYRPRCRQRNHRSSAYSREEDVGEASPSADRLAVFHLRSRIAPGISTWFGRLPPPSCLEMQAKPDSGRHPFSSVLVLTSDQSAFTHVPSIGMTHPNCGRRVWLNAARRRSGSYPIRLPALLRTNCGSWAVVGAEAVAVRLADQSPKAARLSSPTAGASSSSSRRTVAVRTLLPLSQLPAAYRHVVRIRPFGQAIASG